jgi:hypothetical protein
MKTLNLILTPNTQGCVVPGINPAWRTPTMPKINQNPKFQMHTYPKGILQHRHVSAPVKPTTDQATNPACFSKTPTRSAAPNGRPRAREENLPSQLAILSPPPALHAATLAIRNSTTLEGTFTGRFSIVRWKYTSADVTKYTSRDVGKFGARLKAAKCKTIRLASNALLGPPEEKGLLASNSVRHSVTFGH